MQKIFFTLLLAISLLSCDVTKELTGAYTMTNCSYNYQSISNISVSGMNLSNGLSPVTILKVTSILTGATSSIPVLFTLDIQVSNPNQSEALLHGMQYILSIDGIQFTSGSLTQAIQIAPGKTNTMPLAIGLDLASLMKTNSKDAVIDIAKNVVGIGSHKSNVTLQLKPSFRIGGTLIPSPAYIPVSFSIGK